MAKQYKSDNFEYDLIIEKYCKNNTEKACNCINGTNDTYSSILMYKPKVCIRPECRQEEYYITKKIQNELKNCNYTNCQTKINTLEIEDNVNTELNFTNSCESKLNIETTNEYFIQRPLIFDMVPSTNFFDVGYIVITICLFLVIHI